jgi:hypothetical protein
VCPLSETEKKSSRGWTLIYGRLTEGLKISGDKNLVKTGVKWGIRTLVFFTYQQV